MGHTAIPRLLCCKVHHIYYSYCITYRLVNRLGTIHAYKPYWLSWMVIFEALCGCHDVLILGKGPVKRRQRPDMVMVVEYDIQHLFKQTNTYRCNAVDL